MRKLITRLLGLCVILSLAFSAMTQAAERVTYYHLDLLGSPVAGTDTNGDVVWREQYKPYGQRMLHESGSETNKLWYTGKAHEVGTHLSYYGARWYHPELGRFLATDPVDFQEDNIQSFNRYAYANNNPYRYLDPDGRLGTSIHAFQRGVTLNQAAWVGAAGNAALYTGGGAAITGATMLTPDPSDAVGAVLAVGSKADKIADRLKMFSKEKQALVDMAKQDKKKGISAEDMQAYKDLNKELSDPFPANKVRGPESHPGRGYGKEEHGHVGPVGHIPIK